MAASHLRTAFIRKVPLFSSRLSRQSTGFFCPEYIIPNYLNASIIIARLMNRSLNPGNVLMPVSRLHGSVP